jgi:tetratricopeptide (TPR) repeat protein
MQLAPDSAEAFLIRGDEAFFKHWDWSACDGDLRRAVELAPRSVDALTHYGHCLQALGRYNEAVRTYERAFETDPLSALQCRGLARALELAGQPVRAIEFYRKALELEPGSVGDYFALGSLYERIGKRAESLASYLQGIRSSRLPAEEAKAQEDVLATRGPKALLRMRAESALKRLKESAQSGYVPPTSFARVYAALEQRDNAFKYLDQAFTQHVPVLINIVTGRSLDPIRDDPRLESLLRRMNYPSH